MSVDLTDVLERTSAPTMDIDPYAVVHGGRRRMRRRRVTAIASATAVVAALGVAFTAVDRPTAAPLTPAASTSSSPSPDALLTAPVRMDFTQTGTDGEVRTYRFIASPDVARGRNEGRLYVVDGGENPTLIGAVPLSDPERGPVEGAGTVPDRGLVWGVGRVSGNTRANYTLADGTTFSVPVRRVAATPWEVSVIDGLTLAQAEQGGSASDDRGIPVLR